jgi:hypothetical protein
MPGHSGYLTSRLTKNVPLTLRLTRHGGRMQNVIGNKWADPMNRILEYKCPNDIGTMAKIDGHRFCQQCEKLVYDFNNKSDTEVHLNLSRYKGEKCISIQTSRLNLVTRKISRWKLFLLLILNFKAIFFQKLKAQVLGSSTTQTPNSQPIVRTLEGNVLDKKTGKKVAFPTVEVYKSDMLMQTVEGDKDGNFHLIVRGPAFQADTISLRIFSKTHSGSIVPRIKLHKTATKLVVKIDKDGVLPTIPKHIEDPWTGRLLE